MNNQFNQEKFQEITKEIIRIEDISQARTLIVKIDNLLKEKPDLSVNQPQLYQYCQDILIKLRFVALTTLPDQQAFDLIKEHFLDALKTGIDIYRILEIDLCSRPVFARGEFKKGTRQALKENRQKIGSQSLTIEGKPTPQPPTLKNWLLDYDSETGNEKHSGLERGQYLAQNPNVRKLEQIEKDLLRKVLKFYDDIKPTPVSQTEKWIKTARDKGLIPPLEESESEALSSTLPPGTPPETLLPRLKAVPPLTPRPLADQPTPSSPTRITPSEPVPPPQPASPSLHEPAKPKEPARRDIYQEPVEGPPNPRRFEPRIEGNVVDLKNK